MIGDGHKTVAFIGAPNFIYDHGDDEPVAVSADGNSTIRLFGDGDKRSIFLGSIVLRDDGPPGKPQLELCGGNWALVGAFDGVDVLTYGDGVEYGIFAVVPDCAKLHRTGAILGFRLLESVVDAPFSWRADGMGLSVQCCRTKMSGLPNGRALQTCAVLSMGKSFRTKLLFLPSYAELFIASATTEVRDSASGTQHPGRQCHRQHAAALYGRRAMGNLFFEGRLGGSMAAP
jgi:hypothetical protein